MVRICDTNLNFDSGLPTLFDIYRNIRSSLFVTIDLADSDIIFYSRNPGPISHHFFFFWKNFIANQEALKVEQVYTIVRTISLHVEVFRFEIVSIRQCCPPVFNFVHQFSQLNFSVLISNKIQTDSDRTAPWASSSRVKNRSHFSMVDKITFTITFEFFDNLPRFCGIVIESFVY